MTAARRSETKRLPPGAVGPRAIALLWMIRATRVTYRCSRNADRDARGWLALAGYILIDTLDDDLLRITDEGLAFLDVLMRAN